MVYETTTERKNIKVQSLIQNGNIHEALNIYTNKSTSYEYHFLDFLDYFLEGIVKVATKRLKDHKFSYQSFICAHCGKTCEDPVTLKCGHTLSKSCFLGHFYFKITGCPKCGWQCGFSYALQLRTNVTLLYIVEKMHEKLIKFKNPVSEDDSHINKMYDAHSLSAYRPENRLFVETHFPTFHKARATTPLEYYKKGYVLSRLGNWSEAFKALLTCLVLDPDELKAGLEVTMVFQKLLLHQKTRKRLRNSRSKDSLHEDDGSSSDEEDLNKTARKDLHKIVDSFFNDIKNLGEERHISFKADVVTYLDKKEFECPLCMRIFWEPVTTTCGHTFCKMCLNRSLDHKPSCPLCKTSLAKFLAERVQNVTVFIDQAIQNIFPAEYEERKAIYQEEMDIFLKAGMDLEHEIPLFVCTVALPTVPCNLHVFEPRYRLMIRQCIESGSNQFGMCAIVDNEIAEFGTMVQIKAVKYFDDGRSIVDTIGLNRFKILRRGERDGYKTGAIEFLKDLPSDSNLEGIQEKHDRALNISNLWLKDLPANTHNQILKHFGPMPCVESNYVSSPDGPSWFWWMVAVLPIETRVKVLLLSLTSLPRRLDFLYKIILHFQS